MTGDPDRLLTTLHTLERSELEKLINDTGPALNWRAAMIENIDPSVEVINFDIHINSLAFVERDVEELKALLSHALRKMMDEAAEYMANRKSSGH